MKIAVLSGKGGTGKTTVSASLALISKESQYIDCDVEEPNGYIFLKPEITKTIPVEVDTPVVDDELCNGCGMCAKACQFNAIAVVKGKVIIFPEICHHCGACIIACKPKALTEVKRKIGVIEANEDFSFVQGRLDIGEPVAVPVINKLKQYMRQDVPVIIDCSPGASCTVVNSISDCDYCVLVTEPTPFGLHDLKIAVSLVRKLGLPLGIVINKASGGNHLIREFCEQEKIEVLMEIPYSKEIAVAYSNGVLPVKINKEWEEKFSGLFKKIKERVAK